jgi:hypothetical protein
MGKLSKLKNKNVLCHIFKESLQLKVILIIVKCKLAKRLAISTPQTDLISWPNLGNLS